MRYIFKHSKKRNLLFSMILSIILSSTNTFTSIFFSKTIEIAQSNDSKNFVIIFFLALLIYSSLFVVNLIYTVLINNIIYNINISLKTTILESSLDNDINDEKIINLITNDWKLFEQSYLKNIFVMFQLICTFIVSLIVSITYNIEMTLYFMIFSFIPFIVPLLLKNKIQNSSKEWSNSSAEYVNFFSNLISGKNNIKIFGVQSFCFNKSHIYLTQSEKKFKHLNIMTSTTSSLVATLGTICFLCPILIGGYKVFNGTLSLTILIGLIQISNTVVNPLISFTSLQGNLHAVKPILNEMNTLFEHLENRRTLKTNSTISSTISFNNFSLVRNNKLLFSPINLNIDTHDKILITGSSGVGKSTLLHFIKNKNNYEFYGNCLLNDNSKNTDILLLTQTPFIFEMSLKDNICLGLDISDNEYQDILCKLNLNHLECDHYASTNLTKTLSGGEKQRVCLGRLLVRKPSIILLDEITSALDDHSTRQINNILDSLDMTIIEVAHKNIDLTRYTKTITLDTSKNNFPVNQ